VISFLDHPEAATMQFLVVVMEQSAQPKLMMAVKTK
jgi:hypothetical protein